MTVCHCRFCQRATGSAYLIEPIFRQDDFELTKGVTASYSHRSEGSGKIVDIHFCPTCGTKLYLTFERFPDVVGVYGGTFDDPNWFDISDGSARHIFLDAARHGTVVPAGINTFRQHATDNDGEPLTPIVFSEHHEIGRR